MTWVLVIGAAWLLLAALVALLIGRSIRIADDKAAEAAADEPNFVVDPATAPRGFPAASLHPLLPPSTDESRPAARPVRETPTIPGIPAARPLAPGAGRSDGQQDQTPRAGLA